MLLPGPCPEGLPPAELVPLEPVSALAALAVGPVVPVLWRPAGLPAGRRGRCPYRRPHRLAGRARSRHGGAAGRSACNREAFRRSPCGTSLSRLPLEPVAPEMSLAPLAPVIPVAPVVPVVPVGPVGASATSLTPVRRRSTNAKSARRARRRRGGNAGCETVEDGPTVAPARSAQAGRHWRGSPRPCFEGPLSAWTSPRGVAVPITAAVATTAAAFTALTALPRIPAPPPIAPAPPPALAPPAAAAAPPPAALLPPALPPPIPRSEASFANGPIGTSAARPLCNAAQLTVIRAAAVALAQVAPRAGVHPHTAVGRCGQIQVNVAAGCIASDSPVDDARARSQQQ